MRVDRELEFLRDCSDEDLNVLEHILIKGEVGKERISCTFTSKDIYKDNYPKHSKYWNELARELQEYGGNSFANLFRGEGVLYREILSDVCKKSKVKFEEGISTEELEELFLMSILESSLDNLTEEQRKELLNEINVSTTDYTKKGVMTALQVAIKSTGFTPYRLSAIIANKVFRTVVGRGLTLAGNQTLMKSVSTFAGPVGWTITGLWTAYDIAGPAYRVTIPAVLEVIHLRRKVKARVAKNNTFWGKIKNKFKSIA